MSHEPHDEDASTDAEDEESAADAGARAARRKLLKLAVYTAPIIIGTLTVSQDAIAASCAPSACGPNCSPACGPACTPNCPPSQ